MSLLRGTTRRRRHPANAPDAVEISVDDGEGSKVTDSGETGLRKDQVDVVSVEDVRD